MEEYPSRGGRVNGGAGGYARELPRPIFAHMEWAVARVWVDSARVEPPAFVGSQIAEPEQGFAD